MMSTISTDSDVYKSLGIGQQETTKAKGYDDLGVKEFLDLMITEMKNQDPTKPMDNAQLSAQLAQFGSVSGIDQLNESFQTLAGSLTSDQTLQAASLVGHQVRVPAGGAQLSTGGSISGVIPLDTHASDVSIRITDSSGSLVKELNLGSQKSGDVLFNWDGMTDQADYAPAGDYYLEVQAMINGKPTTPTPMLDAKVTSVSIGAAGQGLTLNLDGIGPVALSDISEIH